MTSNSNIIPSKEPVYWDTYDPGISYNPYGIYARLREEAPLYYNEKHDFYCVSRFSDVENVLSDSETYSSARGDILEIIKSGMDIPKGFFIWEDAPLHTVYRGIVSRVFTPKRMNDLEGMIRNYCQRLLDPLDGADRFDFLEDLGAKMPGGVIGIMLGIPDSDRDKVREHVESNLRTEEGKPMEMEGVDDVTQAYHEYVDWRIRNPSDDLMTELLQTEFTDEFGTVRKLTREEVLIFVSLIAGAGNETTSRLIGWIGKVLGDHPGQRREISANPALIPRAIEEILRIEPPSTAVARYVTRDVELYGQVVPAGSAIEALVAAANRDPRRYPDADSFDIHRKALPHITFGRGIHSCLGLSLARVEGRVALEEVLKRFPDWTVDIENARLSSSSTTRGWDTLPVNVG